MSEKLSIDRALAHGCVLVTGATGFVGGCVLERLCRLQPGPRKIYVLVRKKPKETAAKRVKKILKSALFSKVPRGKLDRIVPLEGDVASLNSNLGLKPEDADRLVAECTHVIHVAAFISFAAALDHAVRSNLYGSRAVLELARTMPKLRAMVHVSTAYVNVLLGTENTTFEEKIYPLDNVDPVEVLQSVNSLPAQEFEKKYAHLVARFPNTYALSKRLTEIMMERERAHVPLAIIRPSIILSTWKEPFPGWVDNVNSGILGFVAGVGKGIFITNRARAEKAMDAIPVDMVVSTILAAAAKAQLEPTTLHVFHCTSSEGNRTNYGEFTRAVVEAARQEPCHGACLWYPNVRFRVNKWRNYFVIFVYQVIPAYVMNFFSPNSYGGSVLVDVQRKYMKGTKYTSYFSVREWFFDNRKTKELGESLPVHELMAHPMDSSVVDWPEYFRNCIRGARKHIHGERPSEKNDRYAKRQMQLLCFLHHMAPFVFMAVVFLGLTGIVGTSVSWAIIIASIVTTIEVWI
ncbi:putative fatty acyl-CoA reductase CG8306 [Trichogramma pretiosum]|uniref:putative fatty acyl-CoA reductase CG8306 n=1 Tax=Trichogramma pretiosum TaxID=7493 RepID=UPI0006C9A227|nr:putative fatty acyl-CoA reductase CG8306 [Trichogramma pretiosum]